MFGAFFLRCDNMMNIKKKRSLDMLAMRAAILVLAAAIWLLIVAGDKSSDVFYMIADGRNMLSEGLYGPCAATWHNLQDVICQNWVFCILLALADSLNPAYGPYFVYGPVMLLFFIVFMKDMEEQMNSAALGSLVGILAALSVGFWPLSQMRPEAMTALLLVLHCRVLRKCREYGTAKTCMLSAAIMVAEANMHGTMLSLHFCALAAYAVPSFAKRAYADTRTIRPVQAVILCLSMFLAGCLNPWGIKLYTVPFEAFRVFQTVFVAEQSVLKTTDFNAVSSMVLLFTVVYLVIRRRIGSSSFYLCMGFGVLGMMKVHGSVALPAAVCQLAHVFAIDEENASVLDEQVAGAARRVILPVSAVTLLFVSAFTYDAAKWPGVSFEKAALHIADQYEASGGSFRVITDSAAGSFLEYMGVTDCFADGRAELLSGRLNHVKDLIPEYKWLRSGVQTQELCNQYGDLDGYLRDNRVRYVVMNYDDPRYMYLVGWIERSPDWSILYAYGHGNMCVWEYTGH